MGLLSQPFVFQVTGGARDVVLSDRSQLPYAEAVIHEVLRVVSVFPLTVQHCATGEGAEIAGYQIPKKSHVVGNLYAAMHDPNLFNEPDKFLPERFLDEDGNFKSLDAVIPFGIG